LEHSLHQLMEIRAKYVHLLEDADLCG
jgi:hypothetical protein